VTYPFSLDDRRLIARARERLRWIDTLPEPRRHLAIAGVPEDQWDVHTAWIAETVGLVRGDLVRVWHAEGYWTTEKAR